MACCWVLLGDFNVVMSQDERISSMSFPQNKIDEFVDCTAILGLSDAPAMGHYYTWNNGQKEGMRVWSKLDRVLLNLAAMESHWPILTEFEGPRISDHCII